MKMETKRQRAERLSALTFQERKLREICLWARFIGILAIAGLVAGSCVGCASLVGLGSLF